jgi:hypothetical protein
LRTVIGVVAAMLLIFTLLAGTVEAVVGEIAVSKYAGAASAVRGLSLLMRAAVYLLLENRNVIDALHSEVVKDLPSVAKKSGVRADARD